MPNLKKLYLEKERDIHSSLINLSPIVDPNFGFLTSIRRVRQHYDEPKFWHYSAKVNSKFSKNDGGPFNTQSSGISIFSEKTALLKCLGESIERYCNFVYLKGKVSFEGPFSLVKAKAIKPERFTGYSPHQLQNKRFKQFVVDSNSIFTWTSCKSLLDEQKILVPCQLIYLSYYRGKTEPILYPPISTGTAGGSSLSAAIVRGVHEVVERDAFMIYYLNKLPAPRINLKICKDHRIQKILRIAARYKLEIISLDITTDLPIPVVATVVINDTGIGKAVSVGLKSDLDPVEAIIGSFCEALHTRNWIRETYEKVALNTTRVDPLKNKNVEMKRRALLWYGAGASQNLNFLLNSHKKSDIQPIKRVYKSGEHLKRLISIFAKNSYEVFYKELTLNSFREMGYFVVKVLIPGMQPLHLNEKYPLLGGNRLYTVPERLGFKAKTENELNKYPHPFL